MGKEQEEYKRSLTQNVLIEFLGLILKRQETKLNRKDLGKTISNCKILKNYSTYFKG